MERFWQHQLIEVLFILLLYMRYRASSTSGITLFEVLITLTLSLILGGIAVYNLKALDDPLKNAAAGLEGFFKQVRARAIATTSAYTVTAYSDKKIQTEYADTCSNTTTTVDPSLAMTFPNGARLTDTTWVVCFNPRGLPDANIQIVIQDTDGQYKTIEVFLGGAVREV